jgi:hypothetical protein
LTARLETKREIEAQLNSYQDAMRAGNPEAIADCYASAVDMFFLWHNVTRKAVLNQYQRNFTTYTSVPLVAISKIEFGDLNGTRITATFDKQWDMRGE